MISDAICVDNVFGADRDHIVHWLAHRAAVRKGLLQLGCLPVGMELFPAADDETWEFIKSQIDDADYYVVIVAGKYGSVAPDGTSFTEKEYDYALVKKKPAICFVHGNPGSNHIRQDRERT